MSMRLTTFIGAYVQLEKEIIEKFNFTYKCSNTLCLKSKNETKEVSSFCSSCGSKIQEIKTKKTTENYLNWIKFSTENNLEEDELCFINETGVLFSNYKKGVSKINENEPSTMEISELEIKKMKAEFMDRHIDTISEINRILGKKLEVKFGVFSIFW